ncbi:hypothetical protein D2M30_1601 [Bacillus amyloliquefaciens]|nr:hypothetical protein D2M30_1601 [Bacillus amyloliquefaciens]
MLTDREFEEEDLGFLEQLAAAHPVWKAEEFGTKNAAEFMLAYSMYNGTWLVWELDGTPAPSAFIWNGRLQTENRGSELWPSLREKGIARGH